MRLSACLPSPFQVEAVLDDDSLFALRAMFVWGPLLRAWRRQQSRALLRLQRWLAPLDEALREAMRPCVKKVAAERRPSMMCALAYLLRWPDLTLDRRFVEGFALLGHVEEPALFRALDAPAPPSSSLGLKSAQGVTALQVVDEMCAKLRPHEHSQFLSDFTREEISQGIASGPFTREELDERFGVGQWLPMRRFPRTQSSGKMRPIDDGRSCGHNDLCFA